MEELLSKYLSQHELHGRDPSQTASGPFLFLGLAQSGQSIPFGAGGSGVQILHSRPVQFDQGDRFISYGD